jgi:poly(3-hydroxybutyrate) depolymerase
MALAPWRYWAELARGWFGHPFSPLIHLPLAKRLAASSDVFLRVTERYEKPKWNIPEALPEVALAKPFCNLVHFRQPHAKKTRVLVVAPLSGHHATLLRDTVRALLPEHDVWITDWVNARLVPLTAGPFHLDDYVDYVRDWIRFLGNENSSAVHVVSVCQPTVPVLAAVSLLAANRDVQPKTMTMMGGPIDARRSPTAVNNLARRKAYSWFEQNVIERVPSKYPGYMRRVYPGFLQHLGFVAMNPDRHLVAHWDYYHKLVLGDGESAAAHRRFYDEYNAVLDMPAEYYLDTVKTVFQDYALPKGRMFVRGELVRPQAIRDTALLTIEGELDDISGNGQTEAAHALCLNIPRARRSHFAAPGVGHYGIFSGRRWREMIFPRVRDFIRENSGSGS